MAEFSDFQLEEYKNISQAHFKTNEMIVAFFRFYLLVMALPISFLGAGFVTASENSKMELLTNWQVPSSIFLIAVALLGLLMMCYLTGLRLEALLYARTVNGVRAYFYTDVVDDVHRVLPVETDVPKFSKTGDHIFIVLSFVIFDSLYLLSGVAIFTAKVVNRETLTVLQWEFSIWCVSIMLLVVSVAVHLFMHVKICNNKTSSWDVLTIKKSNQVNS